MFSKVPKNEVSNSGENRMASKPHKKAIFCKGKKKCSFLKLKNIIPSKEVSQCP